MRDELRLTSPTGIHRGGAAAQEPLSALPAFAAQSPFSFPRLNQPVRAGLAQQKVPPELEEAQGSR